MAINVNGNELQTTATGFLADQDDWDEKAAEVIADGEGIALTQRHWDVIHYLREEFFDNHENQPNNRAMTKAMGEKWGEKINTKVLFDLFPGNPSKQAGKIAGLPESRRKGGY